MFKVVWKDNINGIKKEHGVFDSRQAAYESIRAWWQQNDFKPRYVRHWDKEDGTIVIDYGSHYYFYNIVPVKD